MRRDRIHTRFTSLDELRVLECLFGSNVGKQISPDIGNRQGVIPVKEAYE